MIKKFMTSAVLSMLVVPLFTQVVPYANAESSTRAGASDEQRSMMKNSSSENASLIREAHSTYLAIIKNGERNVPREVLSNAKCLAVFPDVITAALVVGGNHGTGIASCRDGSSWTAPAFVNLTGGSLGLQFGGKRTELVLFMLDEKSAHALKSGKFTLGADASVAAGSYGREVGTVPNGVVAYQRTNGVFAGAAITGVDLREDSDAIHHYYNKETSYADLLNGRTNPERSDVVKEFVSALPNS